MADLKTKLAEKATAAVSEARAAAILKPPSKFSITGMLGSAVGTISSWMGNIAMFGGIVGWIGNRQTLSKNLPAVSGFLLKTNDIINLPSAPVSQMPAAVAATLGENSTAARAMTAAGNSMGALGKQFSKAAAHPVVSTLTQSPIARYANKILPANLGERLSQTSGWSVAFAATNTVGSVLSSYQASSERTKSLQQMQFDLTGKMPSASEIRSGRDIDPLVTQARKQEVTGWRAWGARAVTTLGTIGNVALMLFSGGGGVGFTGIARSVLPFMGLTLGTTMASGMLTSGATALRSYRELYASFAQFGGAPVETYEALAGGFLGEKINYQAIHKFAKQCADEKLTPPQTLQRIKTLIQTIETQQAAAQSRKPITIGNKVITPSTSHTDMVRNMASRSAEPSPA